MSALRELTFDWLFNASVQIALFASVAAILSPFMAKAKAKHQYWLYLAVFTLCLAAPLINTFLQTRSVVLLEKIPQRQILEAGHRNLDWWIWNERFEKHTPGILTPGLKTAFLAMWQMLFLYHAVRFSRGMHRVYRLRRDAVSISPNAIADSLFELPHRVALFQSTVIDDPVTIGVFHPAIILPRKVMPALDDLDLAALLAHEYAHIRRRDYLVQILCKLTVLPVAWHPGMKYLMSKISQTRELACDEYAAVRVGKHTVYARTLLRLASLCLQVRRSNAMELGIFDGDNLEDRIMMLTEKKTPLSRAGLVGLALAATLMFGSSAVLARAMSLQQFSTSTNTSQMFAGTWHWMFQGRSFATMILRPNSSGITGTVTGSKIALNDAGELSKADPSDGSAPSPITKTQLEGNALHVTVTDQNQPFEFLVTLKDATHAEIHPIGAPPNMKPIQAEKVH